MLKPLAILAIATAFAATADRCAAKGATAPLWGRWERSFTARQPADPEIAFVMEFTSPSKKQRTVAGFWDGGPTWRVRFMPDEQGQWRYRTSCRPVVAGLDGEAGTFECRPEKTVQPLLRHGSVRVAPGGYHLEHADGTPFFWLGDTVWTGPALSTKEDWQTYLQDRAGKRYSVIQLNTLSPWRTAPTDREGRVAFTGRREVRINPEFFRQLDERIDAINARGMLAALVLIWGNKKDDPGNYLPEEDVIRLLRYQVARYGAHHVVWIMAGDNTYKGEAAERWKRIGRAVFGGRQHALVTTHPTGMNWPWESLGQEEWLTVLGYQSGHGDDANTLRWIHSGPVRENWTKKPARPIINLEPPYEDHLAYQSRQPHSAYSVRRAVYWSLLSAPPAGVTYGGHGLWSWQTVPGKTPPDHPHTGVAKTWREALKLPGGAQMKHVAELFTSLPWWRLRPADDLLSEQPGGKDPARFVAAARSEKGDLALLYLPAGGRISLKPGALAQGLEAEWFDPRTGKRTSAVHGEAGVFQTPDDQDWALILRRPATVAPRDT